MVHNLARSTTAEMGGFRIEVTLMAPTLEAAEELARTLPFFNIKWWIGQVEGSTQMVDIKVVDKRGLLGNARWMYQRALGTGHLSGANTRKATREDKQVINDLLASFGWNGGKRAITKSLDPSAWWREEDLPDEGQPLVPDRYTTILNHLSTHYHSQDGVKKIIAIFRKSKTPIPCQKGGTGGGHKYWSDGRATFRLKCRECSHNLYEAQVFEWFAKLFDRGLVPLRSIGLDLIRGQVRFQCSAS